MPKIMLINVTHAEESRVGIVTDGVLSSFEIESFSREHLKGNIYRGVIHRIHPALEAAFVDIGAERNAFLPLDEICFRNLANPLPAEPEEPPANGRRRSVRIQDILKPGDEILVQIVKEEFANKPPTLSTFYSLPGRYLVLLPGSEDAGISRRIEGDDRQRIRDLIERLQPPPGFGIIVRTAAGLDQSFPELQRDLSYLQRLWESIQQTASSKRAPALVYREHDLVLRNIRDYFTPDIDEIYVDNEEVYERARAFLREVMPGKENVLRLYAGHQPIFSQFNVENQIESIYKRRVPLKSGGSIVLDGTEALTAIDVNSGRSTRGSNQEETAFRTNREAALEIARQLRLRDVGGLIVIDFIDMKTPQHIAEVERT
ncbi:MAG TPA: Rne/Rng family ribonuclease, partial [Terriglobales bacterium]|nr:Rne/Rng family ribonuclease [Terriglobales bacterium]